MKRSVVSGVAAVAASLTLVVAAAALGGGLPSADIGLAAGRGSDGASYIFGGPGKAGSTPAARAHRDLLDHGTDAKILTTAHRGQWREAPENSLAAFKAAYDHGAEIIETDIQLTKDGVPVLMHDTTVDRTTNGRGAVADMTLAQIEQLRLREGLGGGQAAVTDQQVPTLEEAMRLARDRGLINLDKGWPFREQVWQVLTRTGTVRNGLYKSDALVPEVRDFLATHKGALYMHMITDDNLGAVAAFGDDQPVAYEVNYDSVQDAVARKPFLDAVARHSRVFNNTMWNGLSDHMTDEASLTDPLRGWDALARSFDTTIFQTDDVEKFESWLRTGEGDPLPHGGVRVQAEDFLPGEDKGYHDNDGGNNGGLKTRPGEDVDIEDADGNVRVGWMRGGEWLTYDVDVPRTATYALSVRASSPYSPAGTYTVSFDGGAESPRVDIHNTTSHSKEVLQPSGVRQRLTAGHHTLRISLPQDAYQNWNLDYLQLAPVRR
ncbi:glycerophosphodiester phosphodiesterase family protein [Streptomyces sp. MI02-7b]|uniref:glycerophosphodiester phosphodiesterase family protein n=1 Tax=Streptomyces sp. MI02-7b TaxID=462941 RepID=UPI00299FB97A|nr:glycerophosphodiester phosphodiesterase family protein [Streptomyces sp. MI02-7b]MDX3077550.1 glycerophosphodiester phosphodiesterase family protein [Streptomyces sp. MI02-7b]